MSARLTPWLGQKQAGLGAGRSLGVQTRPRGAAFPTRQEGFEAEIGYEKSCLFALAISND
jgi:hypothetical protein